LNDGLERGAGFDVCYSFREWLGAMGGDFVTQEGYLRDTENALGRVDEDSIFLELGEEGAQVQVVFLRGMAGNEDIIQVREAEGKVFEDVIHETLKGLGCIPEAKGHEREFKKSERSGYGGFLDIVRVDRDLVVSPDEVYLGKYGAAGKVVDVVMDVADVVEVWDDAGVQGTVLHTAAKRCPSSAPDGGQMTMVPLRGVLYRPSAWRRTRLWPPRGGRVGTLQVGLVRYGCGAEYCPAHPDGSHSV
jgi:hypothetical protein